MMKKSRFRGPLPGNLREVLFEIVQVGQSLRVSAIDPHTRTEVTMIGDPRAPDSQIKRLAAQKLWYAIEKKNKGS